MPVAYRVEFGAVGGFAVDFGAGAEIFSFGGHGMTFGSNVPPGSLPPETKRAARLPSRPFVPLFGGLEIDGSGLAAAVIFQFVGNALILVERRHAGLFDGRDVDERIVAAAIGLDKAVALVSVEEFYGAVNGHETGPSLIARPDVGRTLVAKRRERRRKGAAKRRKSVDLRL